MVCPSSHVSKLLLSVFVAVLLFYLFMDFNLYLRIQNYPIDRGALGDNTTLTYKDVTWVTCKINPLCDVTVKAVLLDHTNYYLFAPLVTIMDNILEISHIQYITPNAISVFHVFVAIVSAKCISSDSLAYRRVGVLLFEVRTFLDDLDGHVARVRKNVKGERSEIGTTGYYVDGICDALGCTALLIGTFVFLKNNPPRRGYMQLPTSSDSKDAIIYKSKITSNKVSKKLFCFAAQLILSSMAWNRYIALYQDMLERNDVSVEEFVRQNEVFKSTFFFGVTWLWRVVNVHNMLHCLLLGIFCDKLWEFLRSVQYVGFVILLFVIGITEVNVTEVRKFVAQKTYTNSTNF
ncbi:ceramide phosphoethanolamine synthase [Tribolium castaneum]|uniref:Ceramide phosphoethanolamine synthase-like protein n=1 Tax=Tribolium castaneum TaxID=7070 RepID=A0A139WLT0_TRICA|nr:PREDICTED: ceramide phosphoethanolamine synthase isoform X2 [Tribolium castaneum]XP_015833477.1 PREDICTED: ceramide phosphoethanolamine synthase isoform X2 [Tribolium castaneum]XP_015833478.1 PREDICTED: ceramide phosphoethanolamine synthase isoform X2 [Tribolium castaneum]XP_015833479.1 PREDICTED: ceramide phosphoethanolamine synthase isoform X2 [Tribolium castaneum]KYB28787.1 Ceramide phosphoethanolamine synthase-like protein [Tribolium castaneum]|eukprot:XP_015833476.1 PREDICTED: ceramide phosphoethanolamine synthase isoform X2 [Tribolium castaneum]